jgi:hypothetical protein
VSAPIRATDVGCRFASLSAGTAIQMMNPMGKAGNDALRFDFNRRLTLQFYTFDTDAGSSPMGATVRTTAEEHC